MKVIALALAAATATPPTVLRRPRLNAPAHAPGWHFELVSQTAPIVAFRRLRRALRIFGPVIVYGFTKEPDDLYALDVDTYDHVVARLVGA